MIRHARGWRSIAVLGIAGLALAACGGDDETDAGTASVDTSEAPGTTEAESSAADPSAPASGGGGGEGDGVLTLGTLLPETGSLASLGPPEFAGVELAVQEINEAGGVLGADVTQINSDSGDTTTDIATQSANRLLGEGVDAIIGAASSGVSLTVIDAITGAGVVHFSPANTSPDFTDYEDNGLYFRTAPSDVLQGRALGELIVQDGYLDVALLVRQDSYGTGLAENVQLSLEAGGAAIAGEPVFYPEGTSDFAAQVAQIAQAAPEAVVLIGFDETSTIITEMLGQGVGPDVLPTYLVDGNVASANLTELPAGVLDGTKGTQPGADFSDEFRDRLLAVDPELDNFSYGPESYDAAIIIALAAIAADSDAGTDIGVAIPDVTREGTACTTFADCVALLEGGEDIDYDGVSGPIEMSDAGDPTEATIGVYQFDAANVLSRVDSISGTL